MKRHKKVIILALAAPLALAVLAGCGPTADFTASPTGGPPPLEVNFTDQSTGSVKGWEWYFGDGGTSTKQHPTHTYDSTGTYTVTLVVSSTFGEDELVRDGYITVEEGSYNKIEEQGIVMQWLVEGANLHVILSAPTTGWVAVGFDPSNGMDEANYIIGYVSGDSAHIRDDFGTSATAHQADTILGGDPPDGQDNVTGEKGTESEGTTEIQFVIPLDSGDKWDKALAKGQSYVLLLAYGEDDADDFTSKHKLYVETTIPI